MPRLPVESGMLREDRAPRVRLLRRARDDARAERLDQPAPVRLLVVRDLDHVHVDLEPEDPAGERERRAPLARAGLRREARDALLLVVVRLRDRRVRLVRAGRRDALVLVVDARRRLERLLQPARAVERRRPPLPVDRPHLLGDRDEAVGRDLLQDDLHREERREVVRPDRLRRCPDGARVAAARGGRPRGCTRPPASRLSSRTYFTWSDITRSSPVGASLPTCPSKVYAQCRGRSRRASGRLRADGACSRRRSSRDDTFEQRRARMEALVAELRERTALVAAGRRREGRRAAPLAREADRARADRPARRPGHAPSSS